MQHPLTARLPVVTDTAYQDTTTRSYIDITHCHILRHNGCTDANPIGE